MPRPWFESLCVVVIALALALMSRRAPPRSLLLDYASLALAGWLGEESCIVLYRFYEYAPGWHARAHHVPLLVPLIWPIVLLSSREVARALFPRAGRWLPLVVAGLVCFDASLIEVIAVRARLWWWAEPGHLGVPLIGVLGWGYFALGAVYALETGGRWRHALVLALGPLTAHALIFTSWWALFRWTLRGDFGVASLVGFYGVSALGLWRVLRARREGDGVSLSIAAPRVAATGLFLALLLTAAPRAGALWAHFAAVAVPYLASTKWR